MINIRRKVDLDKGQRDWLYAHHHFIVSHDGNPSHTPVGPLIVWNEDVLAPGRGFPPHSHQNLEIITYVIDGAVEHWDDIGNLGRIEAGDVQVMSAGAGIAHEEKAHDASATRLFQLWIRPRHLGGESRWETKPFPKRDRQGALVLLASGHGDTDALPINADARILAANVSPGGVISHSVAPGRQAYLVAATGRYKLNGTTLEAGDGAAIDDEESLRIEAIDHIEILLVEVG